MSNRNKSFLYRDFAGIIGTVLTFIMVHFYICEFLLSDRSFNIFPVIFICIMVIEDFLLRKYAGNLIIYLILHLLPFGLLLIPGHPLYSSIILALEDAFLFYNSVAYWKDDGLDKHCHTIILPAEMILFYILIFIHAFYGLSQKFATFVYIAGITFFILSLLIKYFDRIILETLTAEGNGKSAPKDAYTLNSTLVTLFVGFIILAVTATSLALSDTSFNFIGTILRYIGSFIMSILTLLPKWKEKAADTPATTQSGNMSRGGPGYIEASDNPIANAIFIVAQIFIYILIIVGVIYLIYTFFKQYMYRTKKEYDIIENTAENDRVTKISEKKSGIRKFFQSLSPNEKIRKMYYRKVSELKKMSLKIKKSNTPDEISSAAKSQTHTSIDELSDIYKKARYGHSELTRDDVNRCKELL